MEKLLQLLARTAVLAVLVVAIAGLYDLGLFLATR
jgi:hypothetical protein